MLTVQQAAQQANCHRDTISRAIKTQKLPASIIQGKYRPEYRIKESDLTAWMQQANQNVVTLPVATYAEMQQAQQSALTLVTALMAEIRMMKDASAQQSEDTQRRLDAIMEAVEERKKRPWWAFWVKD